MDRITQKDLEYLVKTINQLTGSPETPYSKHGDTCTGNIGNYHLDYAYGGVNLVRMCNEGGGISQPLGGGFHTKRELYNRLTAFIYGLESAQK